VCVCVCVCVCLQAAQVWHDIGMWCMYLLATQVGHQDGVCNVYLRATQVWHEMKGIRLCCLYAYFCHSFLLSEKVEAINAEV